MVYIECTFDLTSFRHKMDITDALERLNSENGLFEPLSWREMAELLFDDRINPATLSAYARGRRVVNREHRRLLLLGPDRRNRIVINADDPESAALSILTARKPGGAFRASDDFIDRLVELLEVNKK